jgi:hypothetical protein
MTYETKNTSIYFSIVSLPTDPVIVEHAVCSEWKKYISFILQYLFHHSLKHNRFAVVNNGNQVLSMSN